MPILENEQPLVSIIVITYNSDRYVLDTLESAGLQTYRNIELIVSDDGSSDNTISMCREWVDRNRNKFVNTEVITIEKNSGIPANCNRGLARSKGDWIKLIAGDDILMPDCIHDNLNFVFDQKHIKIDFVFSRFQLLYHGKILTDHQRISRYKNTKHLFNYGPRQQFLHLLTSNFVPAPTGFINRESLEDLGGFDEKFPLSEDFPLWLKATYSGTKLHFMDKETVIYRISETSLTDVVNDGFVYWYEMAIRSYFNTRTKLTHPFHYLDFRLRYYHYKRRISGLYSHYSWLKYLNLLRIYRYMLKAIAGTR